MTDVAIFSVGAVMFIMTTWATIAFGLQRVHELKLRDMAQSDLVAQARDDGLTNIYVAQQAPDDSGAGARRVR